MTGQTKQAFRLHFFLSIEVNAGSIRDPAKGDGCAPVFGFFGSRLHPPGSRVWKCLQMLDVLGIETQVQSIAERGV